MSEQLPLGSDDPRIVGSNAWAAAGGPALSLGEKLGFLWGANLAYLGELPGEIRWALSSRGLFPAAKVDAVGVQPLPDTRAVEMAIKALEHYAEGEREVANHSFRTFHFADVLHRQERQPMPMDREVLAVATLLHDVGIYPKAAAELSGDDFTVRGANLVRQILSEAGWSPYRIDLTAQVITLNANPRVDRHWGAEAHFARLAPIVDAAGQCWKVNAHDAWDVFAQYPAGDLAQALKQSVAVEVERHPDSRFSLFKPMMPLLTMHCTCRWHRRLSEVDAVSGATQ